MKQEFLQQLWDETKLELAQSSTSEFAIIGHTPEAYEILARFKLLDVGNRCLGIFDRSASSEHGSLRPLSELRSAAPDVVVIASDAEKERLLQEAQPDLEPSVRVIIAGYRHCEYRNPTFDEVVRGALVTSLANGYPNSLVHIFQCLENAARLGVTGVVAEFGIFKGGTTMVLSRFVERLGQNWKVIGFDTFQGFPPKRSLFDMYAHPDCVFSDEDSVRHYLANRNIEIIRGDIVDTAVRLSTEDIVLAFFDTDNYASTTAILDIIQDRVVIGGALVFDHFISKGKYKYTIGERLAAMRLLEDERYFHLHDTGVFFRQR